MQWKSNTDLNFITMIFAGVIDHSLLFLSHNAICSPTQSHKANNVTGFVNNAPSSLQLCTKPLTGLCFSFSCARLIPVTLSCCLFATMDSSLTNKNIAHNHVDESTPSLLTEKSKGKSWEQSNFIWLFSDELVDEKKEVDKDKDEDRTLWDWFTEPTEDASLSFRKHELVIFVVLYLIAVTAILALFESIRPVMFNPNYPDDP